MTCSADPYTHTTASDGQNTSSELVKLAKEHHNFHILGCGFRNGDTELARLCGQFRAGRDEQKYKIVDFLREKGAELDLSETAYGKLLVNKKCESAEKVDAICNYSELWGWPYP